jgi:hypothetical protein
MRGCAAQVDRVDYGPESALRDSASAPTGIYQPSPREVTAIDALALARASMNRDTISVRGAGFARATTAN